MATEFENLFADISRGRLSPVYFFQGEEPFFIDTLMNEIEQKALAQEQKEFNQTLIYGKDASLGMVLEMARRYPMMSERQTVLVKEAQEMSDLGKKESQNLLIKYLQNPVPSTVLAFAYKGKKLDGKTILSKELKSRAVFFESKKLYDNQLPDWLKAHIHRQGLLIEDQAVFLLVDLVGNDLQRLANEVQKITALLGASKPITAELVRHHVAQTKQYSVFDLQNALANREVFKANQIIDYFISNLRETPTVVVVSSLYSFFAKILQTHSSKTLSQAELAQKLRIHPFFVKDYFKAAKNYSLTQTLQAIAFLHEADLAGKGINTLEDEALILKKMIFNILH